MSSWENLKDILEILEDDNFCWINNMNLKYVDLRIDTRDNHVVIKDRRGEVISLDELRTGIKGEDYV